MKIAFDAKRYFHNHTGLGNYSRTLVNGLRELFPEHEYVLYDESSTTRMFRLGNMAGRSQCDILHGLSNELPLLNATKGRTKHIVTMHDVCWKTFPSMYGFFDRHIYNLKYGISCRKADHVVAITQSTKRDLMEYYDVPEHKITVIYQPVQKHFYTPLTAERASELIADHLPSLPRDFVLYVGSINSRKNLMAVVKALMLIPKSSRPMLLVVGGASEEYARRVNAYIDAHDLRSYVMIKTNLHDNHLLQALYKQAKVFLYPSFYEGFGLPVVEAALQHTPVITTTVSSLPEAAGPDACLIDPYAKDAEEQIAIHMERLLADDAYRHLKATQMENYCRRNFTPSALLRQMMNLYERMTE